MDCWVTKPSTFTQENHLFYFSQNEQFRVISIYGLDPQLWFWFLLFILECEVTAVLWWPQILLSMCFSSPKTKCISICPKWASNWICQISPIISVTWQSLHLMRRSWFTERSEKDVITGYHFPVKQQPEDNMVVSSIRKILVVATGRHVRMTSQDRKQPKTCFPLNIMPNTMETKSPEYPPWLRRAHLPPELSIPTLTLLRFFKEKEHNKPDKPRKW